MCVVRLIFDKYEVETELHNRDFELIKTYLSIKDELVEDFIRSIRYGTEDCEKNVELIGYVYVDESDKKYTYVNDVNKLAVDKTLFYTQSEIYIIDDGEIFLSEINEYENHKYVETYIFIEHNGKVFTNCPNIKSDDILELVKYSFDVGDDYVVEDLEDLWYDIQDEYFIRIADLGFTLQGMEYDIDYGERYDDESDDDESDDDESDDDESDDEESDDDDESDDDESDDESDELYEDRQPRDGINR